ncbi:PfkB family carbohydrate kinase [Alicyclobacillus fastidiosus]|uniref:PfkB family carbohydrate kinase n=1 Tax=Alicyclobacillus fastidiosus TaxID=392011 RepID=UPI0034D5DF11
MEEARETLMPMARQADMFFPGLEEARLLLGRPEADAGEVIDKFLAMGIPCVVLKLGLEGCIYATARRLRGPPDHGRS